MNLWHFRFISHLVSYDVAEVIDMRAVLREGDVATRTGFLLLSALLLWRIGKVVKGGAGSGMPGWGGPSCSEGRVISEGKGERVHSGAGLGAAVGEISFLSAEFHGNEFEDGRAGRCGLESREAPYTRATTLHFKSLLKAARQPNRSNGRLSTQRSGLYWACKSLLDGVEIAQLNRSLLCGKPSATEAKNLHNPREFDTSNCCPIPVVI